MKKLFRWLVVLTLVSGVLGFSAIGIAYLIYAPDLPEVDTLRDIKLQVPLRVFTEDGKLIGVFGEKRRIPVTVEEMPACMKQAFIAGEDSRFYEHPGLDYQGLTRAAINLITTGNRSIGGSTITQQLARNMFLTFDKTFARKIKEAILSFRIEDEFSKDEILELYLNKIFLGHRAYGVGAAAEVYYGRNVNELSLAQCAMIAALPKAPSRINPITSPERALERRDYVLSRMLELGFIEQAAHDRARAESDRAFYHGAIAEIPAPFVAEMVRSEALRIFGAEAYTGGYQVTTTLDSRLQVAANQAIANGLEEYDHRHGFRGAEAHIDLSAVQNREQRDKALSSYRPVSGLEAGLVIEAEQDIALVYLRNGQTVALALEDMTWAAPFVNRDRKGSEPKTVSDVLAVGDIIRARLHNDGRWKLAQQPEVEAALVSLDPRSGDIKALVGGYDFARSKFNRIVQSRRQPGSSFKPFVYSAALDSGFTVASLINDAPIVFEDSELERTWKPENFSQKFYGPTRLREAMVSSRNLVSIRLLRSVGIEPARDYITRFGFTRDELPPNLSMALGSATLTPLSMARGYAVFANGGYLVEPRYISVIRDADANTVYSVPPTIICDECKEEPDLLALEEVTEDVAPKVAPELKPLDLSSNSDDVEVTAEAYEAEVPEGSAQPIYAEPVISPQNAYLVRSMMMDVVRRGTGTRAMQLGRNDLAGKTGTTNEQRDAWFSGYNDALVTSVWVGFDNHEPLGRRELGGRAALPVWVAYMGVALEGVEDKAPLVPEGLARGRINPETGQLARLDNPDAIMEIFEAGTLPPMEEASQGENQDVESEEDPYEIY